MRSIRAFAAAAVLSLTAFVTTTGQAADNSAIAAALTDPGRPQIHLGRDADLKTAEVLAFAGVKPGQTIVDFIPGDGYYTRIFSRAVGAGGYVYPFVPFAGAINADTLRRESRGAKQPVDAVLEIENVLRYANVRVIWQYVGDNGGQFGTPRQADLIWTTQYHMLHTSRVDRVDIPTFNKLVFNAIKPGGVYVVFDTVGDKSNDQDIESLDRIDPDTVKAELTAAGFVLDAESMIHRNPADDHSKHAGYLGDKADRFLLRFKKPANAPGDRRAEAMRWMDVLYGNTWIQGLNKPGARYHFYQKEGTYQELATGSPTQEGYWYVDANANTCLLHQAPIPERAYTICSQRGARKVGDKWEGASRRGPSVYTVLKGIVYPPLN